MIKRYGLLLLAFLGIAFSVYMIYYGAQKPPVAPLVAPPPEPPFKSYIAAQGIIESAYKNISIGSSFTDIITEVYVRVGMQVEAGQPLFKTDTRLFEAQYQQALKELEAAQVEHKNKSVTFSYYERLQDKSATSEQMYSDALYARDLAQKKVAVAQAARDVISANIDRSTIRAPIAGEVLQMNIRVGEYAHANSVDQTPLILFGDTQIFHVRIEIDEEDEWRFKKESAARAFVRGNSKISIPLTYVYTEPYIVPKRNLTGSDIERVDTRVLEVVYKFSKENYPVYAGQLLDVYIEAPAHEIAP